ncbi:MAG: MAPEG family protein [Sandaracinaceae bacterium]
MTIPMICLAVGILLPYVWAPLSFGERKSRFGAPDFALPRVQAAQLQGLGARAMGAHANAFEALTVFATAVLLNHLAGAAATTASAVLAVVWLVARIAHGAFYVMDLRVPRSGAFAVGFLSSLGLVGLAFSA